MSIENCNAERGASQYSIQEFRWGKARWFWSKRWGPENQCRGSPAYLIAFTRCFALSAVALVLCTASAKN